MKTAKKEGFHMAEAYPEEKYIGFDSEKLILVGIYLIQTKGHVCTFEKLVAECFTRFPKVFSFKRFPQWPDALKFDRGIRRWRKKGCITGSIKSSLSLTSIGKRYASEIYGYLESESEYRKESNGRELPDRSSDDRLITYLKNSEGYKRYLENPEVLAISEPELKTLLRCTLETPKKVLKENLNYYKEIAKEYDELPLLDYLKLCEEKYIKGGKNG